MHEFSFRTRAEAIEKFKKETFDLLIIGGGITGAAAARDASYRGLKVAVVEKKDFAWGTSSRSSKLIHGGLRYLQNFEIGLVFEALSERALLLKTAPHLVKPLPFYMPVYAGDPNGRGILTLGMWLYDLLSLFRAPGFHKSLSRKKLMQEIPFLKSQGLLGGFRYFDASMWDDVLAVETLRSAHESGAAVANYVEAVSPRWTGDRISGFQLRDLKTGEEFDIHAHRTVVCAGPWTDQVGKILSQKWLTWLNPSKGVHLIFDLKKLPVPGAMVMSDPDDGRISFVIPRPDYGAGVTIVGTTDGPTPENPEKAIVESGDVKYLMDLLSKYFPALHLTTSDILSAYVGVRPLMGAPRAGSEGQDESRGGPPAATLQKVSREHHIDRGPGGSVVVAGGKYTTHRKMAEEITEFTLHAWREDAKHGHAPAVPETVHRGDTRTPVNLLATTDILNSARVEAKAKGIQVPEPLWSRYGAAAITVVAEPVQSSMTDPDGFPFLAAQLRHAIRYELVMHLEDFYFRRVPLYSARADHGLPWAEELARVWSEELGLSEADARAEVVALRAEADARSAWRGTLGP